MSIVVDRKDNRAGPRRGKADAVHGAEGSSPRRVKASATDATGVGEQGRESQGALGHWGEPGVSLVQNAGRRGVPADQEPWRGQSASGCH
jgi:hypothetical protein